MDSEKQECSNASSPPYSFSNGQSKFTEKESNDARNQFSGIVEEEKTRIQKVAEKENERIMKDLRIKGTNDTCPICLEEFLAIVSHEEGKKRNRGMRMICCNVSHCKNCAIKSSQHMLETSPSGNMYGAKCYNCREPMRSAICWTKKIKPNDQRHWLLSATGMFYVDGTNGLKKNTKKGIKLLERTAELGDKASQAILASYYINGHLSPKGLVKARYYAEKAVKVPALFNVFLQY